MSQVVSHELPLLNLPDLENVFQNNVGTENVNPNRARNITIDLESIVTAITTSSTNESTLFPTSVEVIRDVTVFVAIVACASGYSSSPSGVCVNLQIDFNNCGSFGNVCSSTYTSCSADICSSAPLVQLQGTGAVPSWSGQFSIHDAYLTLNLTLYNISSSIVSVTSNGPTAFWFLE